MKENRERDLDSGKRNEACDPMKKKLKKLSFWSFVLAVVQFVIAFAFFHFFTPGVGLTPVFHKEAGKPMVALLFGVFGVLFLFAGCMSALVNRIVYSEKG